MSRARSHLAAAVHGGTLTPGDWLGDDGGGFHWHLRVEPSAQAVPYSIDRTAGAARPAIVLDTVTVWIPWGNGRGVRQVRLDTRQIAMAICRMGGISRAGNERLRALPVSGATSVIQAAVRPGGRQMAEWLRALLLRKPRKLAAVDKIARIAWAIMTTGESYRRSPTVGAVPA